MMLGVRIELSGEQYGKCKQSHISRPNAVSFSNKSY